MTEHSPVRTEKTFSFGGRIHPMTVKMKRYLNLY